MQIGYGIFGTPHGLQWKTQGLLADADIGRHIDLNGEKIDIKNPDLLLRVYKITQKKSLYTFIMLYGHAREMESKRTGTFCGAFIVLKNTFLPPELSLGMLLELYAGLSLYITPKSRVFLKSLDKIPLYAPQNYSLAAKQNQQLEHSKIKKNKSAVVEQRCTQYSELLSFLEESTSHSVLKEYCNLYCIWDKGGQSTVSYPKINLSLSYDTLQKKATEKKNEIRSIIEQSSTKKQKLLSQLNTIQKAHRSVLSELDNAKTELFQIQNKVHHFKLEMNKVKKSIAAVEKEKEQRVTRSKELDMEIDQQLVMLTKLKERYTILQSKYEGLKIRQAKRAITKDFEEIRAEIKK